MSYTLKFSDNTKTAVVVPAMPPGINAVDTSLSLVGRGYPNYGEKISQNFLYLLENFANQTPPENPIEGQLWYDTSNPDNKVLRVLDGTNWPTVSGIYQQYTDPKLETNPGLKDGDIWVDTEKTQLKIYSSGNWTTVGPSTSTDTGAIVATLPALAGGPYDVILNKVDGKVISIVTKDAFTPNPVIEGFTSLTTGTNLATGSIVNGTALSALNFSINGVLYPSSRFLRKDNSGGETITGKVVYITPADQAAALGRDGVVIFKSGDPGSNYIQFYKSVNDAVVLNNTPGGKLIFRTTGVTPGLSDSMYIEKSLVKINVTTEAVSSTTGALVVAGGLAVGGNLHIGKKLYVNAINLNTATLSLSNTAVSTSTTTGALTVAGGVGIGGNLNVGKPVKFFSTATSTSTTTGALLVSGGVGIGGGLSAGGRIYSQGLISTDQFITAVGSISAGTYMAAPAVEISGNYSSVSTVTGALTVVGGAGIGGAVNIGKTSTIAGARILTTATSAIVYPEDFGAVGDGTTNDYGAIQAAINTGKSVYLTDGKTYYYTTGLTITTNNQIVGGPGVLKPSGSIHGVIIGATSSTLSGSFVVGKTYVITSVGSTDFTLIGATSNAVGVTFVATGVGTGSGQAWLTTFGNEVSLTFNSAVQTAGYYALYIGNANRIKVNKLHVYDAGGGLYVTKANTVSVDWMWAVVRGPGITWYGNATQRSDVLNIVFALVQPGFGYYGLDWDGNCNSLTSKYLGIVGGAGGGKGVIIQNTSGGPIPAIGRFTDLEVDYPRSHNVEITAGLDYDFSIPYMLGAGILYASWISTGTNYTILYPGDTNWVVIGAANNNIGTTFTALGPAPVTADTGIAKVSGTSYSGFKIANTINDYQVRITGGKSIGHTGYGIENAGGVVYFDGTTDLSDNKLGRKTGEIWTTLERLTLDDTDFYLTMDGPDPLIGLGKNSYVKFDRANYQIDFYTSATVAMTMDKKYVQSNVPFLPPTYTVSGLPNSGLVSGMRATVSDCTTTTFYTSVSGLGGGGNCVPVFVDGSGVWRIG